MLTKDNQVTANIPSKDRSAYSQEKWKFLLDAPFEISNQCCNRIKKEPAHTYHKVTGRKPMTAQMASESRLRTQQWIKNGCNGFNMASPISNPMSFWTEQDVLLYIKEYRLPICSVYGDVVIDYQKDGQCDGQQSLADMGLFDDKPTLKTTGCSRTGCMFCGYGCHLEKDGDGRFEKMKETHPQIYDYVFRSEEENGLGYKDKIDWLNEHGNLNIKY